VFVAGPDALGDPATMVDAIRSRGFGRVYVHIDVDCFRPDDIPDTLMQTAGGPPFTAVAAAIDALASAFTVAGFSLVEFVERGGGSLERLRPLVSTLMAAVTAASSSSD
jgi:arginase family enzyme